MRKHLVCAATIATYAFVAAIVWAADEQPTAEKADSKKDDRRAALFDKLDANSDGQINTDEVPEEQRRLFNRLVRQGDSNGDGKLSRIEFVAAGDESTRPAADGKRGDALSPEANRPEGNRPETRPGNRPRVGGEQPMGAAPFLLSLAVFRSLDANGDGALDASEIAAATTALKKLDTNSDGDISREELRQAMPQSMAEAFDAARPAGNFGEAAGARVQRAFAQLDNDADGKLQRSELPEQFQSEFDRLDTNGDGALEVREARRILMSRLMERQSAQAPPGSKDSGKK